MEREPVYTVVIRDKTFILTKSQIEFDSPNFFTTCFLGEFWEAKTRRLELSRDPDLFAIVVDYLCGYAIFPWKEEIFPKRMSSQIVLKNLRTDATYYELNGLVKACDEFEPCHKAKEGGRFLAILGASTEPINQPEIAGIIISGTYYVTHITEAQTLEPPFSSDLTDPDAAVGFGDLLALAAPLCPHIFLVMEHDPRYTLVIGGSTFILSRSQIEIDSPNYFTSCFSGNTREATARRLELSRDPNLFRIIARHLCGYSVLPLAENEIPLGMTPASALANLRADAVFYNLRRLQHACDDQAPERRTVEEQHMALLGTVDNPGCTIDQDPTVFLNSRGSFHRIGVTSAQLSTSAFANLIHPDTVNSFSDFRTLAALQEVLKLELGVSYHRDWKLVGYSTYQTQYYSPVSYNLTILLEKIPPTSQ
ncbi:BTB domain containing protein [Ceratobasidium theobromae]|uniref:BTB domain containing protein n=1 Tax=Ceratobasidium theobromae TaxID=1582974 RepID=A0A5N5QBP2_9AGAM|nr:BTB domain containing protein [Ceratobasidium theobromae]